MFGGIPPLNSDSDVSAELKSRHFLIDRESSSALQLLATQYRTQQHLSECTGLHMFVPTLRCHNCHNSCFYCDFDSCGRPCAGIARIQERLGVQRVSALVTTTRYSLSQPKEIVDEYVRQGLFSMFLRPINPYFAGSNRFALGVAARDLVRGKRWLLLSSWLNLDRKQRQLNTLFALNRRILNSTN